MSESRVITFKRLQNLLIGLQQVSGRDNPAHLPLIIKHRQAIDSLGDYLRDRNGKRGFTFDGKWVARHDLTNVLRLPVACTRQSTQDVTIRNDTENLSSGIYHDDMTKVTVGHQTHRLDQAMMGAKADRLTGHHVSDTVISSSQFTWRRH